MFQSAGLASADRVLEVGCGTGAILDGLRAPGKTWLHGLDLSHSALAECKHLVPAAVLTCGNAGWLPFPSHTFDIACCHYLLLWVDQPLTALQEMKRVTKRGGYILALAEPDYGVRVHLPIEFSWLGKLQSAALQKQGAHVSVGSHLTELFHQADIRVLEAGLIQGRASATLSPDEWEAEWALLESDVAALASAEEIKQMVRLERQARTRARSTLDVPTYFAWGQV